MTPTILYLDFDGVLHPDDVYRARGGGITIRCGELFGWAHYLEQSLESFPSVRIVLSTSWVRILGFDRAKAFLPKTLSTLVVGATFHRRIHGPTSELRMHWADMPRGLQIAHDLARRQPAAWLALDDAVEEFTTDQAASLVPCQSAKGLSDSATRAALAEALRRTCD